MSYNILDFVQIEGPDDAGRYRVYADPSQVYPRSIARIRAILANPDAAILSDAEKPVIRRLQTDNPIADAQWDDALVALADIDPGDHARIQARARALDTALGFFMRSVKLLMIATGRPDYDITLARDATYKLYYPL